MKLNFYIFLRTFLLQVSGIYESQVTVMMNLNGIDTPFYFRKIHTPPPTVLLLTRPKKDDRHHRLRLHSAQSKQSHMIDWHVNHFPIQNYINSPFSWQRHSAKVSYATPAPDVAYRNTYLEEIQRRTSHSPKRNYSFSHHQFESPQQTNLSPRHRSIYDYLQDSIRQIEQQRNCKRDISLRIKRPQNEDYILQRILNKGKSSISKSHSTKTTSSLLNNDFENSPTITNYINHFRAMQTKQS